MIIFHTAILFYTKFVRSQNFGVTVPPGQLETRNDADASRLSMGSATKGKGGRYNSVIKMENHAYNYG